MSSDADADVDADDDADADGDQNADGDVERHFIINHQIYKARAMAIAMMLTLCSGDNFGLDGDMKHIDVIHGLTASSSSDANDDVTIRR